MNKARKRALADEVIKWRNLEKHVAYRYNDSQAAMAQRRGLEQAVQILFCDEPYSANKWVEKWRTR